MTDLQIRPVDQAPPGTHSGSVDGSPSQPQANAAPTPTAVTPAADLLDPGQSRHDTRTSTAGVDTSHTRQANADATPIPSAPASCDPSAATSQAIVDARDPHAGGGTSSTPTNCDTATTARPPGSTLLQPPVQMTVDTHAGADGWLELRIWAEMFNDAQLQRIATNNRAERGGVDPAIYAPFAESVTTAEAVVKRQLTLSYRANVPKAIRDWQKNTLGLGEPLMARLLGHLGHPVIAQPHHWEGTGSKRVLIADEPYERTVSQLWQYCGHGRPGRAKKGATAEDLAALGSPALKMLVHLNAEAMVKAGVRKNDDALPAFDPTTRHAISAFGQVYLDRRTATWAKTHTVECVRCGPSGKPAQPGTPWSPGHQQGDALRFVGKEMLRDLWKVSQ